MVRVLGNGDVEQVMVWGRHWRAAEQYRRDLAAAVVPVIVAATAREEVRGAEVGMTATSGAGPLIEVGWLARGAHVTALAARFADEHGVGRDVPRGGW